MLVNSDSKTTIFQLDKATPNLYPLRLGNLSKEKYAYFSIEFDFIGGDPKKIEGLFQSSPGNLGIRLEQVDKSLIVVYADKLLKEKYQVLVLSDDLDSRKLHHIRIEGYSRNFISINFDGKITQVLSPNISFATSEFLLGVNFDEVRNYSGVLTNISFKKVELTNYFVRALRHLSFENYPVKPIDFLNFMAKGGFFLALIIFLIIRKLPSLIFNNKRVNYFLIGLLTIIQISLIALYDPYRYTLTVYIFLFLVGVLPNQYLFPRYLNVRQYQWLFAPLTGLMMLAIFGSYLIGFGIPMQYLMLLPAITFIPLGAAQLFSNIRCIDFNGLKEKWPIKIELTLVYLTALISPIVIILTHVAVTPDGVTTPFRIGPDAALYAKMTQYLLDGGTWAQANLRSSEFSNMSVGEITRFTNATMDWPFLYFYRWGLSSYQCMIIILNGLDHVYKVAFISMILPVMFGAGIIFYWLRERFKLSLIVSIAGCIGFIFNANLLNLWFEGFYGNMFSLCLYAILFLLIDGFQSLIKSSIKECIKYTLLCALIFSAILLSYGEGLIFIGAPLMTIYILSGLIVGGKFEFRLFQYLIIGFLMAVMIVLPCQFLIDWILITIKQVTQEGGNGYAQPYWAYFNDIVGLNNIYENVTNYNGGKALLRSKANLILALSSSALLLIPLIWYTFKSKFTHLLCISAYILTILFFIYFLYGSPLNNYGYMKAYIFLLPLLYVYFWVALSKYVCSYNKFLTGTKSVYSLMVAVACVMVLNGISYISRYDSSATKIRTAYIAEHKYFKDINSDNAVFYLISNEKLPHTLPAILAGTWISEAWNNSSISDNIYLKSFGKRKIYLVAKKECINQDLSNQNIIQEGNILVAIDSGFLVKEVYNNKKINFSLIKSRALSFMAANKFQCNEYN